MFMSDVVFEASNYTALKLLLWCKQNPMDSVKVSFSCAVAKCVREALVIFLEFIFQINVLPLMCCLL